ncbi:hypothetical protein Pflav_054030 [Phytohabitans flavus]|uniref:Uncharacterized protein n=1 Tax=Phytohabitans flavus TaxID=1076124 RepID=A0A6F8XYV3_9ACTN|nr:hypothetical protein Pflav_054030 [Phytohabitans flavus]
MLTCPKLNVSRIGSNAATRQAAITNANQRVHPSRREIGSSSHHRISPVVTTTAAELITIATGQEKSAIGSIASAAKGGYV